MSKRKIFDTAFSEESLKQRKKLYKQYHSHYEILDQIDLIRCLNREIKYSKARNMAISELCNEKAHIYDKNINDIFLNETNEENGKLIVLDGLTFEPDRLSFSNVNEDNSDLSRFQPKSMFSRANKYAKHFSKLAWRKYQQLRVNKNTIRDCENNTKMQDHINKKHRDSISQMLEDGMSIPNIAFQILLSYHKENKTGYVLNDISKNNMKRLKVFSHVIGVDKENDWEKLFDSAAESLFSKDVSLEDEKFYRLLLNHYWYFEMIVLEQHCANMNQNHVFFDNINEAFFVGKILMHNTKLNTEQRQHIYFMKKNNEICDHTLKFWIELELASENNSNKHGIRSGTMRAVFALQKDSSIEVVATIELDIIQPVWLDAETGEVNQSSPETLAYAISERIKYYDQVDTPEMRTLFQRVLPDYGYYKREIAEAMYTNEKYLIGKVKKILSDKKYDDLVLGILLEHIDMTVQENEEMNGCMLYGADIKRYYNFGGLFCVIMNREKLIERNLYQLRSKSLDNNTPLENVYNRIYNENLPVLVCEEYKR